MNATVRDMRNLVAICLFLAVFLGPQACQQKPDVQEEILNLTATDKEVREAAVKALIQIGPPAVAPLIKSLKNKNPSVQAAAAKALGIIGDKRAVVPLINMMKNSYDIELMFEVAVALSQIGDERACDALKTASHDPNSFVSKIAKKILAESGLCKSTKEQKK